MKPKLLLHVCCGPCSTHALEELKKDYDVTMFWSNSNLYPPSEYDIRLEQAKTMAEVHGISLIEDDYDHKSWLNAIKGFEAEPEHGKRCVKCFHYNLSRTAQTAMKKGFVIFTTTLTISPHKFNDVLFEIGDMEAKQNGIKFLAKDLKEDSGFEKSVQLSKKYGLYRQNYCGCEFSLNDES